LQLGALLAKLADDRNAAAALDAIDDVALCARVLEVGARYDEMPAAYVSGAVRRYASKAADEDWLGLMSALERGDDPGRTALQRILYWALAQDTRDDTTDGTGGGSRRAGDREPNQV